MIHASEMINLTVKESKLAKACAELLDETLEMVAKPNALEGKREAKVALSSIYEKMKWQFSYEEISKMCRIQLEELGYTCDRDTKNVLHIFW